MPPSKSLPTSMVAWQHSPSLFSASPLVKSLTLNQIAAVPPLKKSQTLVKVLSAGINPIDHKLAGVPVLARVALGSPATPGIDYAGRVWATNLPESVGIKAGDLVFGRLEGAGSPTGALAGFTVVTGTEGVVKAPEGVDVDWLGGTGVAGLTAYQGLVPFLEIDGEGSARGKSVLINGASGGVGTYAVQIAKAIGCETIIATCSSANADMVKGLGATEVIDYRSVNVVDGVKSWVKNKNNGQEIDLVVDLAGADMDLYWRCHQYTKPSAKFIAVGAAMSFGTLSEFTKILTLPGFLGGGKRPFKFLAPVTSRSDFERMGQWMKEGKLNVVIDSTYSMEDAKKAYEKLMTGRARGKIVIRVSEDGRGEN